MSHTDALADHHNLVAERGGASAGRASSSRNVVGLMEERKVAAQPRDGGARLRPHRQADDGSANGDSIPVKTQTQKKLKLCRYFGTPGGECREFH